MVQIVLLDERVLSIVITIRLPLLLHLLELRNKAIQLVILYSYTFKMKYTILRDL